jgi:lysophospholipase L1-like esterase
MSEALLIPGRLKHYWQKKALATQPANLVALWAHNDSSGTVCTDSSPNKYNGTYNSVVLNQLGIGDSGKSGLYDGIASFTNLYSTGLNNAFNKSEFSIITWVKIPSAVWAATGYQYIIRFYSDGSNDISIHVGNSAGVIRMGYTAGGTTRYRDKSSMSSTDWLCLALTVSKSNDRLRPFFNGSQYLADIAELGSWATPGNFNSNVCSLGSRYGDSFSLGINANIGPTAVWSIELTPAEVALLASPSNVIGILFIGDSKTDNEIYREPLRDALKTASGSRWVEMPTQIGISGITTALMAARCDADIVSMAGIQSPREIIINLGANDVNGSALADDFETNTRYIVNAYHTAFPLSNIRLTKIWKRGAAVAVAAANVIISAIYLDYTWLKPGIDEALFLEGGDDGATYTTDGVHPNVAGGILEADAWKTAIGY